MDDACKGGGANHLFVIRLFHDMGWKPMPRGTGFPAREIHMGVPRDFHALESACHRQKPPLEETSQLLASRCCFHLPHELLH